jgi:hypothetical protein
MVVKHEEIFSVSELLFIGRRYNFYLSAQGKRINVVGSICTGTTH